MGFVRALIRVVLVLHYQALKLFGLKQVSKYCSESSSFAWRLIIAGKGQLRRCFRG